LSPTIVLVEDAPDQVHLITMFIRVELPHAQVFSCGSVKKACELIDAKSPQLLILDLTLTDGSGKEVIEYLRSKNKTTPVLVVTGDKSEETLSNLFNMKVDDYIVKPIDDLIFQSKVRSLLSGKYVSPLQFLGKRESLGTMQLSNEMTIAYLDEFSTRLISPFHLLPGATFQIKVAEFAFTCKVVQSQMVDGSGINLNCEIDTKSIANRADFRKFLRTKIPTVTKGAA
jgi:DNA-binding response OmpR family regulator